MPRHPADGSIEHPYSALNLRLALALFGFVFFLAMGAIALFSLHAGVIAAAAGVLAALALVNAVVVQRLRVKRRRREHGQEHSLFE
jgi:hypothetical protein